MTIILRCTYTLWIWLTVSYLAVSASRKQENEREVTSALTAQNSRAR